MGAERLDSSRSISEISEIAGVFLSGVRESVGEGRARPVRVPPGGVSAPVSEAVSASGGGGGEVQQKAELPVAEGGVGGRRLWAVVGGGVGRGGRGVMLRVVAEAAASLGGTDGRAGVLDRDGETTRLGLFDAGLPADAAGAPEGAEAREMCGAVTELSGEVTGWVFATDDVRRDHAAIVAAAGEGGAWIVPVEEGEEARVEAYRVIKALSAVGVRGRLVLAAVGEGAVGVAVKLREVMRKFLAWDAADLLRVPMHAEDGAFVHHLLSAGGGEATWGLVLGAVAGGVADEVGEEAEVVAPTVAAEDVAAQSVAAAPVVVEPVAAEPMRLAAPVEAADDGATEVVDCVGEGERGVLASVLAADPGLVGCDLDLPGRVTSQLAADADGRMVVLVAVGQGGGAGVREVAEIGRAWRWVRENAAVVARAVRPVRVEAGLEPQVRLYVSGERAGDLAAMLEAGTGAVRVMTYRPLRWGGKRGLLLEAA